MDHKKAIGGTGTVLSLSAGVFLQQNPTFAHDHPHWVTALYVVTVAFLFFTLLQFKLIQRILGVQPIEKVVPLEKPTEVVAPNGIGVGGDVKGSTLGRFGDIIGTEALKEVLAHQRAVAAKTDPPVSSLPSPLPALKCRARWIDAFYEVSPGCWTEVTERTPFTNILAVAMFQNPAAAKEKTGIPLAQIEAQLVFHAPLQDVSVNTAYWLDSDHNRMDIPAGHERCVVLGHFEGEDRERFVSYRNPFASPNRHRHRPVRQLTGDIPIIAASNITVEVILVDRTNRTVEHSTIEICIATHAIQVVSP